METCISIINAIAIIAVLIGHLGIIGINDDFNTPVANIIVRFILNSIVYICIGFSVRCDIRICKTV